MQQRSVSDTTARVIAASCLGADKVIKDSTKLHDETVCKLSLCRLAVLTIVLCPVASITKQLITAPTKQRRLYAISGR